MSLKIEDALVKMALRIAELEDEVGRLNAYIEKREEYVEFLAKELGDAQFDLMTAEGRLSS